VFLDGRGVDECPIHRLPVADDIAAIAPQHLSVNARDSLLSDMDIGPDRAPHHDYRQKEAMLPPVMSAAHLHEHRGASHPPLPSHQYGERGSRSPAWHTVALQRPDGYVLSLLFPRRSRVVIGTSTKGTSCRGTQAAVVLGASGSVGRALIKELIRDGSFKPVVTLVRRSLEGDVVGLSVLGVGAGTAKLTLDEPRAVDVQLNAAFARAPLSAFPSVAGVWCSEPEPVWPKQEQNAEREDDEP
jgi:hypothetical protein